MMIGLAAAPKAAITATAEIAHPFAALVNSGKRQSSGSRWLVDPQLKERASFFGSMDDWLAESSEPLAESWKICQRDQ